MFWKKFAFQHASGIDTLLDRDDVSLEAILDEDDLLSECHNHNTRLIDYFQREDVLRRLLGYASGEIEGEGLGRFKYPHVATEVLCSDIWSIVETCLAESDQLLVPFWDTILDMNPEELAQKSLVASHFAKINSVFMNKKPEEMLHYMQAQPSLLDRLLSHIESPSIVDLLFRMIQLEELPGGAGAIDWLASEQLIPRLISFLSPTYSPDRHAVIADVLKGIVAMCAPSPTANNENQIGLVSNRFVRQLVSSDMVHTMVAYMLDHPSPSTTPRKPIDSSLPLSSSTSDLPSDTGAVPSPSEPQWDENDEDNSDSDSTSSSTSSSYHSTIPNQPLSAPIITSRRTSSLLQICSILIELMRKHNSDFFEPYLFHTFRHRLIQIQQHYLPQLHQQRAMEAEREGNPLGPIDPVKRAEEDRETLERAMDEMADQMGIVHFGTLIEVLGSRLHEFQALLAQPRSLVGPIQTTLGPLIPVTLERFRICELYAELLHCSSLGLLNRPEGYGPRYDEQGRLTGGLAALEELARVISNELPPEQDSESTAPPVEPSESMDTFEGNEDETSTEAPPTHPTHPDISIADAQGPSESPLEPSLNTTDSSSLISSESGDAEYLSVTEESSSETDEDSASDDVGLLEEIEISGSDAFSKDRNEILNSVREPLLSPQNIPFAVPPASPSAVAIPVDLPTGDDVSTLGIATSPASDSSGMAQSPPPSLSHHRRMAGNAAEDDDDIDPFTDPNDIPPSPPPSDVTLTSPLPPSPLMKADDSLALGLSEELDFQEKESTPPLSSSATATVVPSEITRPVGDFLKRRLLDLNVVNTILDLFFDFPWNNFLHNVVYDMVHQLMTGKVDRGLNRELMIALFREGRLLHRIIDAQRRNDEATSKPKGVRLGYMGHITLISEDIISAFSHYPPDLISILSQYAPQPEWDDYVSGRYQETKDKDTSQLGGGKPVIVPGQGPSVGMGRGASPAATLAVDEADRPVNGAGRGTFTRTDATENGGVGASPAPRKQNVVFAPTNEDETESNGSSNGSGQSDQFAQYLVQQINSSTDGHFESSSSSDASDDEDDVGWLGDTHLNSDLKTTQGASSTGASSSQTAAFFDDSFGNTPSPNTASSNQGFVDDDDFGPFGTVADVTFSSNLSSDFSFPPTSSALAAPTAHSPSFDLDAEFEKSASSFTFGSSESSSNGFNDDDDDGFGDFQGGVGLEVVMSTNADGVSEELPSGGSLEPSSSSASRFGGDDVPSTDLDWDSGGDGDSVEMEEGEKTPKASRSLFFPLDTPTEASTDSDLDPVAQEFIDPDPFGFRRGASSASSSSSSTSSKSFDDDDPFGSEANESSPIVRSSALESFEETFGSVNVGASTSVKEGVERPVDLDIWSSSSTPASASSTAPAAPSKPPNGDGRTSPSTSPTSTSGPSFSRTPW